MRIPLPITINTIFKSIAFGWLGIVAAPDGHKMKWIQCMSSTTTTHGASQTNQTSPSNSHRQMLWYRCACQQQQLYQSGLRHLTSHRHSIPILEQRPAPQPRPECFVLQFFEHQILIGGCTLFPKRYTRLSLSASRTTVIGNLIRLRLNRNRLCSLV